MLFIVCGCLCDNLLIPAPPLQSLSLDSHLLDLGHNYCTLRVGFNDLLRIVSLIRDGGRLEADLGLGGASGSRSGSGTVGDSLSGDPGALCLGTDCQYCYSSSMAFACRFMHLPSLLVGSLVEADYQYLSSRRSLSGRLTG